MLVLVHCMLGAIRWFCCRWIVKMALVSRKRPGLENHKLNLNCLKENNN